MSLQNGVIGTILGHPSNDLQRILNNAAHSQFQELQFASAAKSIFAISWPDMLTMTSRNILILTSIFLTVLMCPGAISTLVIHRTSPTRPQTIYKIIYFVF